MRIIDRDLFLGLSKNDNLEESRPMETNSGNDASVDEPMERRKLPYATVQKPFSTLELAFYTLIATEQEPIFGYLGWKHVKAYRFLSQRRFPYGDMREELAHLHKYFICPLADIYLWHIFIPSGTIYYIDLLYILLWAAQYSILRQIRFWQDQKISRSAIRAPNAASFFP